MSTIFVRIVTCLPWYAEFFSLNCFVWGVHILYLLWFELLGYTCATVDICLCTYNRWLKVQLVLWQLWVRLGKIQGLKNLIWMRLVINGLQITWQLLKLLLNSCSRLGLPLYPHWLAWVPFKLNFDFLYFMCPREREKEYLNGLDETLICDDLSCDIAFFSFYLKRFRW